MWRIRTKRFDCRFFPNDGVGLAREEFIVTNSIGIHPKALIEYHKPRDPDEQRKMDELTVSYADKPEFFIERLSHGIAMIAAAFYPKPVILRCSDFKTNEYANLLGGADYEPREENPMIGFSGCITLLRRAICGLLRYGV